MQQRNAMIKNSKKRQNVFSNVGFTCTQQLPQITQAKFNKNYLKKYTNLKTFLLMT